MNKTTSSIVFASGGTILVLWQMLLLGYVLTWDMVFGPSQEFPSMSGLLHGAPLTLLIYALGFIVPMWLVQKGILIALFFSLFYLPIRFSPFKADLWVRFAAASLYAVNPFVYERFLAGHWKILAGYALLAPLIYFLLQLVREPSRHSAIFLAITMLCIGVFSLHVFVMSVVVATAVLLCTLIFRFRMDVLRYATLAGGLVAVGSLYWVVPYVLNPSHSPVANFSAAHWDAFTTSTDPLLGTVGNVLALYGFWGESYPWLQTLLSPKDSILFMPTLLALAAVIALGARALLRLPAGASAKAGERATRLPALALMGISIAACIFSVGLAASHFHGFNTWLFEHVSFWRGFRDTEKWSMWLALSYAYFFASGAAYLAARAPQHLTRILKIVLVLLPLLYTPTMLAGFTGQLRAVYYPPTWYEVNAILEKDPECKALFLPWHQYYWLSFNRSMLTGNPAPRFFDCEIVSSQDAEIGEIGDQGKTDSDSRYRALAQAVTRNDSADVDSTLLLFRELGIRYIVATNDIRKYDQFTYPFLGDPSLELLYNEIVDNQGIALFRL